MAIPMNLQQYTNQKTKKIDDLFQQAVSGSLAGAKTPAPISTASQAVAPAPMPQTGGYKWGGNTYGSVEEQQKAMKAQGQYAPNPGAVTSAAVSAAPGVATTAPTATDNSQALRTKFQSALAPQVTEAINTATSQVNPFMTGQRAGEITRQAIKPAQEKLAQFEIEQEQANQATKTAQDTAAIETLGAMIKAGTATQEMKDQYNKLVGAKTGLTSSAIGATGPAGIDFSTGIAPASGQQQSTTFDANYGDAVTSAESQYSYKLGGIKTAVDDIQGDTSIYAQKYKTAIAGAYDRLNQLSNAVDNKVAAPPLTVAQTVAEFQKLANGIGSIPGRFDYNDPAVWSKIINAFGGEQELAKYGQLKQNKGTSPNMFSANPLATTASRFGV